MSKAKVGGFGTQPYWMPDPEVGGKTAQILQGKGYVSVSIITAHYRTDGNFWTQIFGGADKVTLTSGIVHKTGTKETASASIEDTREFDVEKPSYFGLGSHFIALMLPTDCNGIEVSVSIAAVHNDNLSGALNLLNSGELKSTLQLAPPAVSQSLAIANIVKKLLTSTDPKKSLEGKYGGKVSAQPVADPLKDCCLCTGYLILLYRESSKDTDLDDLDTGKFKIVNNVLKYDGQPIQNTYVVLRYSFDEVRGIDKDSEWYKTFLASHSALDDLATTLDDKEREKIFATSMSLYKQAHKLLQADPSYTISEAEAISADQLSKLMAKYKKPTAAEKVRIIDIAPREAIPRTLRNRTIAQVAELSRNYRTTLQHHNLKSF